MGVGWRREGGTWPDEAKVRGDEAVKGKERREPHLSGADALSASRPNRYHRAWYNIYDQHILHHPVEEGIIVQTARWNKEFGEEVGKVLGILLDQNNQPKTVYTDTNPNITTLLPPLVPLQSKQILSSRCWSATESILARINDPRCCTTE